MKKIILVLLLVPTLVSAQVDGWVIKKQAEQLAMAVLSDDYQTIIKFTYPKVVESLGGPDKMIAIIKKGNTEMANQGISFHKVIIGEQSGKVVNAGNEIHCLIPQTTFMKGPGGKVKTETYLLAISKDKGKHWYFIDAAQLTNENVKSVLPNYNAELKLPAKKQPEFIKD
jgi:hypothetical protein